MNAQAQAEVLKVTVPIRLRSEANIHDHWTKKRERKQQQQFVIKAYINTNKKPNLPCKITFTRIAPRPLDIDNLWSSMKFVIDVVCDWMIPGLKPGHADSDKRIEIDCKQRKGSVKEYALEIEFLPHIALK